MAWLLLLLLIVAGPGPGFIALKAADAWDFQTAASLNTTLQLQQNTTSQAPDCSDVTQIAGCATCEQEAEEFWRCTSCAGSLLLLRNLNACGCPPGSFNAALNQCRDCLKGSFCAGGQYTGEDNTPAATPCSIYGPGLTTQGIRTTRKEGCINLPGYSFITVGPDLDPRASPCPMDTFGPGLRKQRGCVACPPGYTTFNRTLQTNIGACDIDACLASPCGKNMDCLDLPKPAGGGTAGRECKCIPGTTFVSELLGCYDPAETAMVGAPESNLGPQRTLASFETRCPRGSHIIAMSGVGRESLLSIGPLSCSDGTGAPLVGFGQISPDGRFTTRITPDGFVGMTVTADESTVKSVSFARNDGAFSATYGTMADITFFQGRRQIIECPNFGVAIGLIGIRTVPQGAPVQLGLICSGLPCPVRTSTIFGPFGAGYTLGGPSAYLQNSPEPIQTATATQCCGACRHDFRCHNWIRDDTSGSCWLVHREPQQPGMVIPGDWAFQTAQGYSSGATTPKASGISVSGTYMGCYRDTGCDSANRLKTALVQSDPKLTVKRCLDLALLAGWPYAGLAPGSNPGTSSCFGGDKLPAAAANPGCFAACAGNKTERCGDGNCQVSVYSVFKPRWPLDLIDRGDPTRSSGWYDVQCQGGTNDYCRWVGNTSNGTIGGAGGAGYWSCAMAGLELPETPPGRILEDYIISTVCQETGYKAQPQRDLTCGDLSLPRENNCQTRQCCKTKCDSNRLCTGFVFGNSAGNNCRSNGDGQNCCWLKGGTCTSAFNPLTAAYQKTEDSASCMGYPPDPKDGIIFCPDNGNMGFWPQGTRCTADCKHGTDGSDQKPYSVCQSDGTWSQILGQCKPECLLPPLLCP